MTTSFRTLLFLVLLSFLGGCSRSQQGPATQITGTISFGEPVTLDPGSKLELRLTDVSVTDGPAVEIATATEPDISALPHQYALAYDASKIDPQHRYTIDARILSGGTPRYATDTAHEVLTQGHGSQRDITVIKNGAINNGASTAMPAPSAVAAANTTLFQNELRTGANVSLYKAGLQDGHIIWLEEDRTNGTPVPLHARYEFKGALVMHYADSSSLEIRFDERGRPTSISRNQQPLALNTQSVVINEVRNHAALLRSHALATSEARAHRLATGG